MKQDDERRFVLTSKVRAYKGWSFKATCPKCHETRSVALSQVPQDITIQAAKDRLRCHKHHILGKFICLSDTQNRDVFHF
ncbi:hypothetical protein GCM10022398_21540 [Acetobacter lovaniensis]